MNQESIAQREMGMSGDVVEQGNITCPNNSCQASVTVSASANISSNGSSINGNASVSTNITINNTDTTRFSDSGKASTANTTKQGSLNSSEWVDYSNNDNMTED